MFQDAKGCLCLGSIINDVKMGIINDMKKGIADDVDGSVMCVEGIL